MIFGMTKGWGAAASLLVLGAVTFGMTGCGGAEAAAKAPAASPSEKPPSVSAAGKAYADDLNKLAWGGCPDDCDPDLNEIVANARTLRKAMNTDPAGATFWSPAYRLIDRIEEGRAKVQGDARWNRALILGPAHELNDWLSQHPTQ